MRKHPWLTLWLTAALLLIAIVAFAQPPATVKANAPLTLAFTHDGQNTDGYRFKLDGQAYGADIPAAQLASGTLTKTNLPGIAAGTHSIVACAFNVVGESCTAPLSRTFVSAPPLVPSSLTITLTITVAEDGSLQFKFVPAQQ